jgi:hypothetical protein
MVLAGQDAHYSEKQIIHLLNSQPYGTPSFAVKRLNEAGFTVNYREWSIGDLFTALTTHLPLVIFVRTGFLEYWQEDVAHALVVVGGEYEQHFWVHDPMLPEGPKIVSWDGLLAAWGEFNFVGATITR